jgi:hypothetical protein
MEHRGGGGVAVLSAGGKAGEFNRELRSPRKQAILTADKTGWTQMKAGQGRGFLTAKNAKNTKKGPGFYREIYG